MSVYDIVLKQNVYKSKSASFVKEKKKYWCRNIIVKQSSSVAL